MQYRVNARVVAVRLGFEPLALQVLLVGAGSVAPAGADLGRVSALPDPASSLVLAALEAVAEQGPYRTEEQQRSTYGVGCLIPGYPGWVIYRIVS